MLGAAVIAVLVTTGVPAAATAATAPTAPMAAAVAPETLPSLAAPSGEPEDVPPAALPAAQAPSPDVEQERLTAPAPSPDAGGAAQATSPDPLKLVAVTWTGAPPQLVELRSRLASGLFGPWTRVDPVDTERDGRRGPPTGTEPVWVADSREVQVRASTDGRSETSRVALTSIDPGTSTNDARIAAAATTPGGATGSPSSPALVTRAQWGADERLMTWTPEYTPTVRAVTVHHTAGTNSYTAADSAAIVRGIYAYHARTQGWGDIGYHVLVDKFGTVFEGRAGGLARSVIAAHAGGFNRETFGIAMMGDYTAIAPSAATLEATAQLAAYKLGGLYRAPNASVTLTSTGGGTSRYPAGRAVSLPAVFAHRDVGATECPGNTGVRSMPTIRSRTTTLVGDLSTYPIRQKWLALRGVLAEPSVVESPTARSARVTRFSGSNGAVYWSSATGAWAVQGTINARYDALGAAGSVLALPRTDERATPDGRGRYNQFQSGVIYWTPQTGAWPVRGPILTKWAQLGYERSSLGYPRGDQRAVTGGQRQDFERGYLRLNTTTGVVTVNS
ncbi:N-acetylmuramoyl-L-alanine amidase [Actinomycetospora straminea]|uniref:N-acetylmuramoyl-L-alanine amidase n=1 Tax=Actinomycetospora straminea TaxID=663607 RepID=UPI00236589F0|nr:N-acetylmuramoyl-L-alanine amidase [Actinomycetospora straminea]MDD7933523.1 N-acetylmuramoyl-L-alanine amidase [Actinomycetospora straminea]